VIAEPDHRLLRQHAVATGVFVVAVTGETVVGDRVNERLQPQLRRASIAGEQCCDGREVAAGAVANNADLVGIGAEARGIRMNPSKGGIAVVHRSRKFVLRPHAIIDRSDHRPGSAAEGAGDEIVRIETADDVAAAMKIDDGGYRRCRL
jgi:hypothetical protein